MTLYRWSTDEEEQDGRHTSPDDWVRVYDDYGEFSGLLVPVEPEGTVLWCFTHWRIPDDGVDLCGDEWREIGPCEFGRALIVRAGIGETP